MSSPTNLQQVINLAIKLESIRNDASKITIQAIDVETKLLQLLDNYMSQNQIYNFDKATEQFSQSLNNLTLSNFEELVKMKGEQVTNYFCEMTNNWGFATSSQILNFLTSIKKKFTYQQKQHREWKNLSPISHPNLKLNLKYKDSPQINDGVKEKLFQFEISAAGSLKNYYMKQLMLQEPFEERYPTQEVLFTSQHFKSPTISQSQNFNSQIEQKQKLNIDELNHSLSIEIISDKTVKDFKSSQLPNNLKLYSQDEYNEYEIHEQSEQPKYVDRFSKQGLIYSSDATNSNYPVVPQVFSQQTIGTVSSQNSHQKWINVSKILKERTKDNSHFKQNSNPAVQSTNSIELMQKSEQENLTVKVKQELRSKLASDNITSEKIMCQSVYIPGVEGQHSLQKILRKSLNQMPYVRKLTNKSQSLSFETYSDFMFQQGKTPYEESVKIVQTGKSILPATKNKNLINHYISQNGSEIKNLSQFSFYNPKTNCSSFQNKEQINLAKQSSKSDLFEQNSMRVYSELQRIHFELSTPVRLSKNSKQILPKLQSYSKDQKLSLIQSSQHKQNKTFQTIQLGEEELATKLYKTKFRMQKH